MSWEQRGTTNLPVGKDVTATVSSMHVPKLVPVPPVDRSAPLPPRIAASVPSPRSALESEQQKRRASSPKGFQSSSSTGRDGGPAYKNWLARQQTVWVTMPRAHRGAPPKLKLQMRMDRGNLPDVANERHMPEHKKHGYGSGRRIRVTKRRGFNSSQQTFRGDQSPLVPWSKHEINPHEQTRWLRARARASISSTRQWDELQTKMKMLDGEDVLQHRVRPAI